MTFLNYNFFAHFNYVDGFSQKPKHVASNKCSWDCKSVFPSCSLSITILCHS